MDKYNVTVFVIMAIICLIVLGLWSNPLTAGSLEDAYFKDANPRLTVQERAALAMIKKWRVPANAGLKPVLGENGTVKFVYGSQQVSIVCAVLQICDVALQPGEQVNSIHIGDQARWLVEPAITGTGRSETQHLIIKPMDVGLSTSLIVTTNRRSYHMQLRSHRRKFMPRVAFIYPEDVLAKFDAIKSHRRYEAEARNLQVLPTGEYLGDLDFGYEVSGTTRWKPVRVYNDGIKMIIQMPSTITQTDAPTLLVLRDTGWFESDKKEIINYRMQGDRYIVDGIPEKVILIAGVGSNQERITITKGE